MQLDQDIIRLQKIVQNDPKDSRAFYLLGQLFFKQNKWEQAAKNYQKAFNIDPKYKPACISLSLALSQMKMTEQAVDIIQNLLDPNPQDPQVYAYIGFMLNRNNQINEAIDYSLRAIRLKPYQLLPIHTLAYIYVHLINRPVEAVKQLQNSTNLLEKQFSLCNFLGKAYFRLDRFQQAQFYYFKSIHINPIQEKVYVNLGQAYFAMEKRDEATKILCYGVQINPNSAQLSASLGYVFFQIGKISQSIKWLRRANKLKQNQFQIALNLAIVLRQNKQFYEAIKVLMKCMQFQPFNYSSYAVLASIYKRLYLEDKAHFQYEAALYLRLEELKSFYKSEQVWDHQKNQEQKQKKKLKFYKRFGIIQAYCYLGVAFFEMTKIKEANNIFIGVINLCHLLQKISFNQRFKSQISFCPKQFLIYKNQPNDF